MASYYLIFLTFVFIIYLHGLLFHQNHRLLPIFISAALAFLAVVSHGLASNPILLPYHRLSSSIQYSLSIFWSRRSFMKRSPLPLEPVRVREVSTVWCFL